MNLRAGAARLTALALAAVVVPVVPAPPSRSAEAVPKVLTIEGTQSSFVEFVLRDAATVAPADSLVETEGSYGGFALYAMPDHKLRTGRVLVSAFEETGHPFGPLTFSRVQELTPGVYRAYLLADGPTTVRVPIEGLRRSVLLRPREPARIEAATLDLANYPLLVHGGARIPIEVEEGNWMYLAALQVGPLLAASRMSACAAPRGGADCMVAGEIPNGTALYTGAGVGKGYAFRFSAGSALPGPKDLLLSVDGAGVSESIVGFYVVIHGAARP